MKHNISSDEDEDSFNLNQIIAELKKLTPQIVAAVEHHAIEPGQAMGYTHWAKSIIYMHGDLAAKAMLAGAQLIISAVEASKKRNFVHLKNLCAYPERFLSGNDAPERYETGFIEALIRAYEISGTCHSDSASNREDYEIAINYLHAALALLTTLQKANPTYGGYLLEASITTKIHHIEKHLN